MSRTPSLCVSINDRGNTANNRTHCIIDAGPSRLPLSDMPCLDNVASLRQLLATEIPEATGVGDQLTPTFPHRELRRASPRAEVPCGTVSREIFQRSYLSRTSAPYAMANACLSKNPNTTPKEIVRPEGKPGNADEPARTPSAHETLKRAVLSLERAHPPSSPLCSSEQPKVWQGLAAERWSLMDHFESNGNRYVLARENCPNTSGFSSLTQRERQVVAYAALGHDNKIVAFDLGIAHATVRVPMSRAANKLGVRGRRAAIDTYLLLCPVPAPPATQK